jgi:hypothetical protein
MPGKCSLSSISAAIAYSAWWKEIEPVKARGKRKSFLNGFWPANYSSGKLGLRLLAVPAFRGIGGVQPKRKKNTGAVYWLRVARSLTTFVSWLTQCSDCAGTTLCSHMLLEKDGFCSLLSVDWRVLFVLLQSTAHHSCCQKTTKMR